MDVAQQEFRSPADNTLNQMDMDIYVNIARQEVTQRRIVHKETQR